MSACSAARCSAAGAGASARCACARRSWPACSAPWGRALNLRSGMGGAACSCEPGHGGGLVRGRAIEKQGNGDGLWAVARGCPGADTREFRPCRGRLMSWRLSERGAGGARAARRPSCWPTAWPRERRAPTRAPFLVAAGCGPRPPTAPQAKPRSSWPSAMPRLSAGARCPCWRRRLRWSLPEAWEALRPGGWHARLLLRRDGEEGGRAHPPRGEGVLRRAGGGAGKPRRFR